MIQFAHDLRPDLYPWESCPRTLATGELVETRPTAEWSPTHGVRIFTRLDGDEYVATGSGRLAPLGDVESAAAARGWSVQRTARMWPVIA